MPARIAAASAPFPRHVQDQLDRITPPGREPLMLFTTLARDERLFERFFGGGLLDRGHLTLRQREIVIDRTTALCRCEYEWGVHIHAFGAKAQLTADQVRSLACGGPDDACWTADEALLVRLCDELHHSATVSDALWHALRREHTEEAVLELLMLAGFYHSVSYVANALQIPQEPGAARFP